MSSPNIVLTLIGKAKIADAVVNGSVVDITHVAFGDGGGFPVSVNRNRVALVNEVYRTPIDAKVIDANDATIQGFEYSIPADEGGFWMRENGLFDADGDLIAHGPISAVEKPAAETAFAIAFSGKIWVKIVDADTVSIAVSVSSNVPNSRRIIAGLGLSGFGQLDGDIVGDVDFSELLLADDIPMDLTFVGHSEAGETASEKHLRTPLSLLDERWRPKRSRLLLYGQF